MTGAGGIVWVLAWDTVISARNDEFDLISFELALIFSDHIPTRQKIRSRDILNEPKEVSLTTRNKHREEMMEFPR